MKKLLALLLALLLTVTCLVACGESKDSTDTGTGTSTSAVDEDKTSEDNKAPVSSEKEDDDSAASEKEDDDKDSASEKLDPETIVGTWEGTIDGGVKTSVTFNEEGDYIIQYDKESVEAQLWKTYEGATLADVRELIFNPVDQSLFDTEVEKLLDDGWTEEEIVQEALEEYIASMTESLRDVTGSYEMTVKGVLRIEGEKREYTYKNGKLIFSVESEGVTTTITLTKK